MNYVKHFNINGVDTKQVACIELHGKPNAATEGAVGVIGIDVNSPTHDVYKCVAVNGSIYTWELLSSGMSTLAATISGNGAESVQFPYDKMKIPSGYVLKTGDLIIDNAGYLYQVSSIDVSYCNAIYCGTAFMKGEQGEPGLPPYIGENGNWWVGDSDTGVVAIPAPNIVRGSYVGTGKYGKDNPCILTFERPVKYLIILPGIESLDDSVSYKPINHESYYDSPDSGEFSTPLPLFGVNYRPVIANASSWSNSRLIVTQFDTTVSWYYPQGDGGGSAWQRNLLGYTYEYVAFM
jgi:hypothetical protein